MKIDKSIVTKSIGILSLIVFITLSAFVILNKKNESVIYTNYADFLTYAHGYEVEEVTLSDSSKMQFSLKNSDSIYETENPRSITLKEDLLKLGIHVTEGNYVSTGYIFQTAFSLCFFSVAFYLAYKLLNKKRDAVSEYSSMGTPVCEQATHFDDVAGNDEAKDSVNDIVDFIKNPEKYEAYGARMPKGVIFYGPPGTGKTLLAKAIAGEANVPFYAVSGSDFVQMYVGVGAGRIRDLFRKARENGRAVIFIDEIDALGKKRSNSAVSGNDERDQTLNALLTEMSGFSSSKSKSELKANSKAEGIVVIAATNRIDTLDEALLRPGRFDRQVEIGLPDMNARLSILKLHARNKPLSDSINIKDIAKQTVYFSGAMLENLLNEAAISAAKRNFEKTGEIEQIDIDTAYYTVVAGSEKKDRSCIKEKDRKITAFHESGHAIAAKLVSPENIISKVTIIPSTKGAGGFCINIPPDKMYYTKKELEAQVIVALSGRAAEEIIFGSDEITTGASNDLEKASQIVTDYITKYGMANNSTDNSYGIKLAYAKNASAERAIYDEYSLQIERLYESAKSLISSNFAYLKALAEALLEQDTLNEDEIDMILKNIEA